MSFSLLMMSISTIDRANYNTTSRAILSSMNGKTSEHFERRRRSDGERSHGAILDEAVRLATVEGIDGLSLARLADAVGMSKSGLFAHFRSKQELQLATVETASAIYDEQVIEPARGTPAGVPRLRAYIGGFRHHGEEGLFPGGCFCRSARSR